MKNWAIEGKVIRLIVGVSAAFVALSVVVLVFYLIRTLKSAERSFDQVNRTLAQMQQELTAISSEARELLQTGQQLAQDVQSKMQALDPISQSLHQAGEVMVQVTNSIKQVSAAVSTTTTDIQEKVQKEQGRISETVEWAAMGFQLGHQIWQKWKTYRKEK